MLEDEKGIETEGKYGGEYFLEGYECAVEKVKEVKVDMDKIDSYLLYNFEAKIPFSNFFQ